MTLTGYLQWVAAHEKLLLVALAGGVLWFGIGRVDTLIQNHDNAQLHQAQVVAQAQIEKNAALSAQVAADDATMKQMVAANDAKQTALNNQIIALAQTLAKQQKADTVMTPTDLTARWNVLVPEAGASTSNGQVTLPESGAVATVVQLENVPVQAKQIDALHQELASETATLAQSQKTNADLSASVTGLNLQIVDAKTACQEQIKTVKDAERKSKRRWFIIGYIAGFLSRQVIKTETGL